MSHPRGQHEICESLPRSRQLLYSQPRCTLLSSVQFTAPSETGHRRPFRISRTCLAGRRAASIADRPDCAQPSVAVTQSCRRAPRMSPLRRHRLSTTDVTLALTSPVSSEGGAVIGWECVGGEFSRLGVYRVTRCPMPQATRGVTEVTARPPAPLTAPVSRLRLVDGEIKSTHEMGMVLWLSGGAEREMGGEQPRKRFYMENTLWRLPAKS